MEIALYILLAIVLICQGTYVFVDATKNKIPFKWLWGFFCLLNIPTNLIIYLIYKKIRLKKLSK